MFDEKVILPEQLPIKEKERKITDCCCSVIGGIFALTMFIIACVLWNRGILSFYLANFYQINNTRTGPDYKPCAVDEYVMLNNPDDFNVNLNSNFSPDNVSNPVQLILE